MHSYRNKCGSDNIWEKIDLILLGDVPQKPYVELLLFFK